MAGVNFTVAADKCISCNACVDDCPSHIIKNPGNGIPVLPPELEADCLECQHCLAVCPTAAVSIFGIRPGECLPLDEADLPSFDATARLLRGRRSVRQFLPQNVNDNLIDKLLATVANAPTGCNARALRFTVIRDRETMRRLLERIIASLEVALETGRLDRASFLAEGVARYRDHGIDDLFRGAPHALIVSAGPTAVCPEADVNIALSYFELLVRSAGLGALWCGLLGCALQAAPELKTVLGLDGEQYFYTVLFGVPAVHYARTVKRDGAAEIRTFTAAGL